MLFAIDIDGTIATNGNWYCRWMNKHARLAIPEERLDAMAYGFQFWEDPAVLTLSEDERKRLRKFSFDHHKDRRRHIHAVPIPGAMEAMQTLLQHGKILYVTCRKWHCRGLSSAWLKKHGFPEYKQVRCCSRYYVKFLEARRIAEPKEPIILIDDLAEKMVRAFRALVIHDRKRATGIIKRLTVVAIGETEPPTFPFKVPFPVLALPSWQPEHIEILTTTRTATTV